MRVEELLEGVETKSKPILYLDMDGVIADLYNHAAEIYDVDDYKNMTPEQWEKFFKDSNAYELFRDISAFPSSNQLVRLIKKIAGGFTILSSPLNFDKEGSIKGKREWLKKHLNVSPDREIFDHEKYKYAVQPDGTPNVLIDDYTPNITKWQEAGGIGIKYQADEQPISDVINALKRVFKDK
jgi:5'(3')-deoxyribonucleotidase